MKIFFTIMMLAGTSLLYGGDIYVISPQDESVVAGTFTLQVQNPYGNPESVDVIMIRDVENSPDVVVWKGSLKKVSNYSTQIDTKTFPPGEYNIDLRYFYNGRKYDEDIEVYIQ